jgi:hypothetical protein
MRLVCKLSAFVMLLVMTGVPVMACLAPGVRLTQEEQACCREMAEQCGGAGMVANHSCCQKIVSVEQDAVVTQFAATGHALTQVAVVVSQVASALLGLSQFDTRPALGRHPPPASPATTQVLRI